MTSCDTNILLYALNSACAEHAAARRYLEAQASSPGFAICELVLMELYVLLRNPAVVATLYSPADAVAVVQQFRSNRKWRVIDYPGGLMPGVWRMAGAPGFPRRAVIDARLALTLLHYGVREFATRNTAHFQAFGVERLMNPIAA